MALSDLKKPVLLFIETILIETNSQTLGNIAKLSTVCALEAKSARGLLIETEGLLKVSHVYYSVKVAISRKLCKIETLLLQTSSRK